jgi:hypothetical protein
MLAAAVITVLPLFTRDVLGADEGVVAVFQLIFTIGAALGRRDLRRAVGKSGDALRFSLIGAILLTVFPARHRAVHAEPDARGRADQRRRLPVRPRELAHPL